MYIASHYCYITSFPDSIQQQLKIRILIIEREERSAQKKNENPLTIWKAQTLRLRHGRARCQFWHISHEPQNDNNNPVCNDNLSNKNPKNWIKNVQKKHHGEEKKWVSPRNIERTVVHCTSVHYKLTKYKPETPDRPQIQDRNFNLKIMYMVMHRYIFKCF